MSEIVLLSGGLDSSVLLADAVASGVDCRALAFAYGQRHEVEIVAAQRIADHFGVSLSVVSTPLRDFIKCPLTSTALELASATLEEAEANSPAYVPGRNGIFLSIALGVAESVGANSIAIGATLEDQLGFPDCRREYFDAFESLSVAAGWSVAVRSPFYSLAKADVVELGRVLRVPFGDTISCYNATGWRHCGRCDACVTRRVAFDRLGLEDPAEYAVEL